MNNLRRVALIATAGVAALSLATGCGLLSQKSPNNAGPTAAGSSTPGASPSTALPDLCNLITDKEIADVTGVQINKHAVSTDKDTIAKGGTGCQWSNNDQLVLTLDVYATNRADFDEDASIYPKVDGVGQAAYEVGGQILYVFQDNLNISCIGPGKDVRIAAVKKAIEKLANPSASPSTSPSS